jgi:predicted xylose isomerase-like sugar epimerase
VLVAEAAKAGLHIFTFNQVRQAEQWRAALLARGKTSAAGAHQA